MRHGRLSETNRGGLIDEEALVLQARMLERMDRVDEAIRVLGADIAVKRYGTQNTPTAYAELLSRHGQLDDLRKLASGEHAHTVLDVFADALRDRGRTAEAETVMRDAIAADDWVGYRAWLSLEPAAGRPAGRRDHRGRTRLQLVRLLQPPSPTSCTCFRPSRGAVYLLDHPLTVPHHDHEEFQHSWRAFASPVSVAPRKRSPWSKPTPIRGPTPALVRAAPPHAAGHLERSCAELRAAGTAEAREDLFEVLVKRGASGRGGHRSPHRRRTTCRRGEDRIRPRAGGRVLRGTPFLDDAFK